MDFSKTPSPRWASVRPALKYGSDATTTILFFLKTIKCVCYIETIYIKTKYT